MGLLDDLLGQLSGGVSARGANPPRPQGGMGNVMVALLPVVLGMLASTSQRGQPSGRDADTGGGLGDILGRMLGGASAGSGDSAASSISSGAPVLESRQARGSAPDRTVRFLPTRSRRYSGGMGSRRSLAGPE